MTVYITLPTRPKWSQRMNSDLESEAVEIRMQKIACYEANRLPGLDIEVWATDGSLRWKKLHWPANELSFWTLP